MGHEPDSEAPRGLFTPRRVFFALLAGAAFVSGWVGLWQYVHTGPGAAFGRAPWDVTYYVLQLFVLGAKPLEGPGPFNPAIEVARYLAAATTVYAVGLVAAALFGDAWRRWRRRRTRGHAIVVGATAAARAIAARRAATLKVLEVRSADGPALRGAGIAGARVVYACGADGEDVVANLATALAAAGLRRDSDLRINVHVTDPTLALGLKARRLMRDEDGGPVIDFFSLDEMAARKYVESEPFDGDVRPRILVAGAGAFGQAVVVEFARQWRERSPLRAERLHVSLVDKRAAAVAALLADRWPVVDEVCDIEAVKALPPAGAGLGTGYYRVFFCQDDEQLALSGALSAVALWRGGPRSVVVRLNQLARHGAAFDGAHGLLDDLGGRLSVVNVADIAGDLVVQDREPVRDLAEAVHGRYVAAQLATRVLAPTALAEAIHENYRATTTATTATRADQADDPAPTRTGPALRPWAELSEDLRHANQSQARDFTTKLRLIDCTIAPRSAGRPAFELSEGEVERLARHEHDRWVAERTGQGWRLGDRDDDAKRHPDLIPWERLSEESKNKDREAVRNLPTIYDPALAEVGLQIVRLSG